MPSINPNHKPKPDSPLAFWFPLGFFLVCAASIWFLWRTAENMETGTLQAETNVAAEQIKMRLESWIHSRIAVVDLLANMDDLDPVRNPDDFRKRAHDITAAFPGFQALNFIDPDYIITIIYPVEGNQAALGKDLHLHPDKAVVTALNQAHRQKFLIRTPILNLLQGKPGFATYCPILTTDGKILGYINGVFSLEKLVTGCLHEKSLRERFDIGLFAENGTVAYHSLEGFHSEWPPAFTREYPVHILNYDWLLRLAPTPERLGHHALGPDEILALGGGLLIIMLTVLLRAYLLGIGALRNSREGYRVLVDNIADMVVTVGPDGSVVFSSPSFLDFLGQKSADIFGGELSACAHPDDRQAVIEAQQSIRAGSEREQFEVRMATPSGYRWTQWTIASLCSESRDLDGMVSVGRDIQDRRLLEDQLRQSQKLQAVGQLAGGIAHDFNNIIQAIQGNLEFALEDLPADSPTHRDLEQAHKAAERAATLTSQILAFSSHQNALTIPLDLNETVANMRPMLMSMLGKGITLEIRPNNGPAVVSADPGQIEQILMNLCLNAREAMSGSGRLTIAIALVKFGEDGSEYPPWARPGVWLRLTVQDSGVGISPEIQDKVFEPFFTTRTTGKGTGLGLATVYGITRQHDGFVHLDSTPGEGATFAIYLRPDTKPVLHRAPEHATAPTGHGETILVVEDEDLVLEMTARILTNSGYKVLTASEGSAALDLVRNNTGRIDAVLLDLVLPGKSGRKIHAAIAEIGPDIPTLFMTGFDPEGVPGSGNTALPGPLLVKPFSRMQLLNALNNLLHNSDDRIS